MQNNFDKRILFAVPAISNEMPEMCDSRLFEDFIIELHEDQWRQIEFLPLTLLPAIQEEMVSVEAILFPEDESDGVQGYNSVHVREKIGGRRLSISFDDFCELLNIRERGSIRLSGYSGFVKSGFAVRSDNYTYYGLIEDKVIKELCLQEYDSADDEFINVVSRFELVLVSWCKGGITGA
jgi:hypothetical protein